MDYEVLKEMKKALGENKTIEKLTVEDSKDVTLPKEFCSHVLFGIGLNASLSEVHLNFVSQSWDCPGDGRLVYVSRMLCDSVGCSV